VFLRLQERQSKRPLFDLTNLDKAAKPIETEAVGKHQMNEKASQWQLRTWPSWNASLGDRHMMLNWMLRIMIIYYMIYDRRKFGSQTSDNMDRWKAEV
jgi:hypothetical protein